MDGMLRCFVVNIYLGKILNEIFGKRGEDRFDLIFTKDVARNFCVVMYLKIVST